MRTLGRPAVAARILVDLNALLSGQSVSGTLALLGEILGQTGLAQRIYSAVSRTFDRLPGKLLISAPASFIAFPSRANSEGVCS